MAALMFRMTEHQKRYTYAVVIGPRAKTGRLSATNNLFHFIQKKRFPFHMTNNNLQADFGNIDIYLFDQLLKGRFDDCRKILDAGCGSGRNIVYFLRNGYEVHGVDLDPEAVTSVRALSAKLAPGNAAEQFAVASVEELPYDDASFDLVICNTVFHFASSPANFEEMVTSVWRVLKPGGYLFSRLASDIGLESLMEPRGNGRYLMPDGSERYLVNQDILMRYTHELNGELYEPIKTTNVNNIRCMTTWCMQKKA